MEESQILTEEFVCASGKVIGHLCLNAKETLNALTLEMIDQLASVLVRWQADENIVCVILSGSGEKAFCAGGDIKKLYHSIIDNDHGPNTYATNFFSREYRLDYLIHTFGKPVICWGGGIVMGGGMGLIAGASHRIVTENTTMAMPEISIGLFPDVGGSWFLNRMTGHLGLFAGLTGIRMKAADTLFARLADYYLDSGQWNSLVESLVKLAWGDDQKTNHQMVSVLLQSLSQQPDTTSLLESNHELINQMMDEKSPVDILDNVRRAPEHAWLIRPKQTLEQGCPVTAWLIYEQLRRGKEMLLADVFRMELNMAIQCTRHRDLAEGVRALLIDRTKDPAWSHSAMTEVPMALIDEYFIMKWPENRHPLADL
ncbi:MAG: enoyl-CoA hydratase/isomerase family protein [Endozoicomonadaceae bacterium]|nr:enoyl-CoA hydratase/isomerase family protein [Endozoicomonadaceae bacterium]